MKILYWNICYWNIGLTTTEKDIFGYLEKLDKKYQGIDYFCLSEVPASFLKLFEKNKYKTFYKINNPRRGILIASRAPFSNERSYLLSDVIRKKEPVQIWLSLVEVPYRKASITIALTHLTKLRLKELPRRRLERRRLVSALPKEKTIFGGDLNTMIIPLAKWDVVAAGYFDQVQGRTWRWHWKKTFKRMPVTVQLDFVFATPDLHNSVRASILSPAGLSDHAPILVKL